MRTATHGGYLTAGLAYAFHPHRDTWYSAPMNQINWWIPMYEIEPANAMAFHLRYWSRPLRNGSAEYDYAKWTRESRQAAAQQVTSDTRPQPRPEEPLEVEPDVRVICPPGGILVFSAAHLHSTVPNTSGRTRFSIDFRTVNIDDVMDGRGAPNVDSACTGTTMGDYLRGTDLAHVPAELIDRYTTGNLHCLEHAASHAPSLH
jgi:ectoine hydroxylase-related dioxygenase (phytanoyl-CoA dioxygenase family)